MKQPIQFRRLVFLACVFGIAFVLLGARLVYLHVVRQVDLGAVAVDNTSRELFFEPRRGDILDAKHNLLATSVFVKTVCVDPTRVVNQTSVVARALAPVLEMTESDLLNRMIPRWYSSTNKAGVTTNRPIVSVVLKRKVSTETWQKVHQTMTNLQFGLNEKTLTRSERLYLDQLRAKAVFTDRVDDQLRVYPNGRLASHVIGGVGTLEKSFAGHRITEITGVDGVEFTMNTNLSGIRGWRQTEFDIRRREQVSLRAEDVAPHDGLNVVLTIDSVLQSKAEEVMAEAMAKHTPLSASCLMIRPKTGEILAMATLPNFDPAKPDDDVSVRRNRLIADVHEPGSTFKVIVVSAALNENVVTLRDPFFCENGLWMFAGKPLHDHEPYPTLSVEKIITKSSNIGAAKIALKLGQTNLYRYMTDFGIGTKTGINLRAEERGLGKKPGEWKPISITRIAMGHEIAVTPLQITMAMCAIANGGFLMKPIIVDRFENREGQTVLKLDPQPVRRVIGERASREMIQALKTVVTPDGTAEKATMEHHVAAGKTGTAEKAGVGGYVKGKYFSSFIGFFPADRPELCIAVFLDEPREGYYGGRVAGPLFKQLAEYAANYLNITPDILPPASATNSPAVHSNRTAAILPRAASHD